MKKLAKLSKVFIIVVIVFFIAMFKFCGSSEDSKKTKEEIVQEQKDSIQAVRDKKIDFALTHLKDMIKKNMKNPDSYEMIDRVYDTKDTGNVVKLGIRFRGDNSFGGKSVSRVDAVYNFEKDNVTITNQTTE